MKDAEEVEELKEEGNILGEGCVSEYRTGLMNPRAQARVPVLLVCATDGRRNIGDEYENDGKGR